MYYVYILKWKKYYCGSTNNLERRIQEHLRWKTITTRLLKINELIWYYEVWTEEEAIQLEIRIKQSGHIDRRIEKDWFIKLNRALV